MSDQPKQPPKPKLTIEPSVSMGQYTNFVSIAHNYTEVLFDFGRTLPGRTDIPVVSRLIMTPFHAKQLVKALNHNIRLYEQKFGAITDPPVEQGVPSIDGENAN